MIELDAEKFIQAVQEVRRLSTIAEQELSGSDEATAPLIRERMASTIGELLDHLALIGAQSAWVSADRFAANLADPSHPLTYGELKKPLADIESRFSDHLQFIKLFVVRGEQMYLLGSPIQLLGEETAKRFPNVWFDCEEAAKCLLVQRPTAAVFHAMRMLEVGIKAFAKRLRIEDPTKPSQRNWGIILGKIRTKIDSEYPASHRIAGSEGAFFDRIYATLDAVKNPWRNETMHVQGVYQDGEARHILSCAAALLQIMAEDFDEEGIQIVPIEPSLMTHDNVANSGESNFG